MQDHPNLAQVKRSCGAPEMVRRVLTAEVRPVVADRVCACPASAIGAIAPSRQLSKGLFVPRRTRLVEQQQLLCVKINLDAHTGAN